MLLLGLLIVTVTLAIANRSQQDALVFGCQRGNLIRAIAQIDGRGDQDVPYALVLAAEPIQTCARATDGSMPSVPVSDETRREYLRIVEEERRWPIVDAESGLIEMTRPLPGDDGATP